MTLPQRIVAGLAIGAAAVALPFAATSPASADEWHLAGSTGTHETCVATAEDYLYHEDNDHDYTEYKCVQNGSGWQVWVR